MDGSNMGFARKGMALALAIALCAGLGSCSGADGDSKSAADAGASAAEGQESATPAQDAIEADAAQIDFDYSERDQDASFDASSATSITLSEAGAQVEGAGASAEGGTVTIAQAGTYVVSGSSDDAQVVVAADDDAKVQIVLDGVTMSCGSGPCINVQNADKVFLTLAEGSDNSLSDGEGWTLSEEDGEPNATVYSTCDLTVNGAGSLSVNATVNNGISTKDDLTVTGGSILVNAANNALRGNDKVLINDGEIELVAEEDGIKSANEDDGKGVVSIDGGRVSVTAGDDGIDAYRFVRVTGGEVTVSAQDDAIHSDIDAAVLGGTVTLDAGDDAVHADDNVWVGGGTIAVNSCYEGLEGQCIDITDGDVLISSTDDSLNASSGSTTQGTELGNGPEETADEESIEPPADEESFEPPADAQAGNAPAPRSGSDSAKGPEAMDVQEECSIVIAGGQVELVSEDGDSIDSNGSIRITGGVVMVSGTTRGDNGVIDSGTTAQIDGGTFLGLGAQGMQEAFDSSSSQASIVCTDVSGKAGDTVEVIDSTGSAIASYTAQHDFSWIIASSPSLSEGQECTVTVNGEAAGSATASTQQESTQGAAMQFGGQGGPQDANGAERGAGQPPKWQ